MKKKIRTKNGKEIKGIHLAAGFLAFAILVAAGVLIFSNSKISALSNYEYIFPNVYVAGINVGGLTKEQARQQVSEAVNDSFRSNTLTVELPDRKLAFPPELTGAQINVDEAVEKAYAHGREGSRLDIARALKEAENSEHHVALDMELQLDRDYIRSVIEKTAGQLNSRLTETTYQVEEDRIIFIIGTIERHLDVDDLFDRVLQAFSENDFTTIVYNLDAQYPASVDLDGLYKQYCVEPVDAIYNFETGEITPEIVGRTFDLESERQFLAFAEEGKEHIIEIKTVVPEVTAASLEALLFRDLLGSFESTLSGSNYNRNVNVTLSSAAVNGTVLQPGEVFSFNNVVGERTAAKGYAAATVYVSGDSVQQLGGGICQVSSTIYLASLLANLEIVERACHQFLVTYIPYGQDATIYWGSQDFKFKNNTDYPIRIDAEVKNGKACIYIYGTKLDDTYVKMSYEILSRTDPEYITKEDPTKPADYKEITQFPYTGYSVRTYRNIYSGDGTLLESKFEASSYYQRRDQITVVGVAEVSPSPDVTEPVPTDPVVSPAPPEPSVTDPVTPTPQPSETQPPTPEPTQTTEVPPTAIPSDPPIPTDAPQAQ